MEITIFSIDPTRSFIYFGLFIGIFAVIGIGVYLLLTKPGMIRTEFRGLFRPVSRRNAVISAAIIILPFALYIYWDCWSYYYTLSLRDNKLIVKYFFPDREYHITDLDVLNVVSEDEARKGMVYRIKLVTTDHSYASQQMTRREFEANKQALTQVLQKQINQTRNADTDAASPAAQVTP